MSTLWYKRPAAHWEEALPLGNGRLGAMVFGDSAHERLALNEDTLWSGYPADRNNPDAARLYPEAQRLALEGKLHEAQRLIEDKMLGGFTQSYLPLGDLLIDFAQDGPMEDYRRALNLSDAVHTTEFSRGGARHKMECFISHPARALFLRLTADRPGALSFALRLKSRLRCSARAEGNRIDLDALAPSNVVPSYLDCADSIQYEEEPARRGMRCRATALVRAEGARVTAEGGALRVEGATEAVVILAARTSHSGFDRHPYLDGADEIDRCERDLAALKDLSYEEAKRAHIRDHRAFFDRAALSLGGDKYANLPIDERLRLLPEHPDDHAIYAYVFDFARYLMIAASRPGTQPMNLQGIWSQDLRAIWSCNHTININTQMNYWPAEAANLPELHEPLFELIDRLSATGQRTARLHYGARGAVAHHNTDLWGLSNPVGERYRGFAGCAFWPMGYAWLCRHPVEHYQLSGDKSFLKDRALPPLRLAARFLLDAMAEADGKRFLSPATSPENTFVYQNGVCRVARRASMSDQITREVLENYLFALKELGLDEPMAEEASAALPKIPEPQIGSRGQLLEWDEEFEENEPRHRHTSHLYGLYPGSLIPPVGKLADACRRTLENRGDDGTGWSLGWKICLWARLGDGDHALKLLKRQLRLVEPGSEMNLTDGGSYASLLDAHPPFQIDGNFGACAGILEMLLQHRDGEITLLPACPSAWREGSVRGFRAPGALADFDFEAGRVTRAHIKRTDRRALKIRVNSQIISIAPDDPLEMEWKV
jgi:alpha-L-fucosidase 2